jgi:L-aspartate oxidase
VQRSHTYDEDCKKLKVYLSKAVVCATGGYGQIYANTTNPEVSTGDGMCIAYRAGAELSDLEFVQFHPTVLFHPENKTFLISEAVRGEGAILRNKDGKRFMPEYHELGELAPRDIVSRSIFAEMKKTGTDHVYLDITFKDREHLEKRFPTIFKTCLGYGIDMSKDYIPVAPTEHYCMGGIKTDVYGRTNIAGFYACGETACNGIHGANRLASNSLLEGLVFGYIISNRISSEADSTESMTGKPSLSFQSERKVKDIDVKEEYIQGTEAISERFQHTRIEVGNGRRLFLPKRTHAVYSILLDVYDASGKKEMGIFYRNIIYNTCRYFKNVPRRTYPSGCGSRSNIRRWMGICFQ